MNKERLKNLTRGMCLLPALAIIAPGFAGSPAAPAAEKTAGMPVILDTDIGDDIDDTWALVMLLKSPELDLKLVTTTYGKADYRAKLIAKLLAAAGRADIPVGLGAGGPDGIGGQEAWVKDYDLAGYAGKVHEDGVRAMIDVINASSRPVTLVSIGPSTTVAEALRRDPGIAAKTVFVGMQGSVRKGYEGGPVCAEYNVKSDIPAARRALLAPWKKMIITPLDTCGLVRLSGGRFRTLRDSPDALVRALMENYRMWAKKATTGEMTESSVLFDTVAVYLALPGAKPLLEMEDLSIDVTPEGMMRVAPAGKRMSVATAWKDLGEYENLLVNKLAF